MSKSTGNFLTLNDAIKKYGADATRIAMADAGDGVDDANFDESVANQAILRMHTLKEWCEEVVQDTSLRAEGYFNLWDQLFTNEMNELVDETYQHYAATNFKVALKTGLFDFQIARDQYRESTAANGLKMNREIVCRYIELQALILSPIASHIAEYLWSGVLKQPKSIQLARWPEVAAPKPSSTAILAYIRTTTSSITSSLGQAAKKKSKGKTLSFDPSKPKLCIILCTTSYPAWQDKYVELVREAFDSVKLEVDDSKVMKHIPKGPEAKKAISFVHGLKTRLRTGEDKERVFAKDLLFDEVKILTEMVKGLKRATGAVKIDILDVEEGGKRGKVIVGDDVGSVREGLPPNAEGAVPGNPTFHFENVSAS